MTTTNSPITANTPHQLPLPRQRPGGTQLHRLTHLSDR